MAFGPQKSALTDGKLTFLWAEGHKNKNFKKWYNARWLLTLSSHCKKLTFWGPLGRRRGLFESAGSCPLISRDIHSGLYVVMSPLIQHNMARSLPQDLYQQGRQARPSQHSQFLPAVIIIWQWLSRVMPPSRPGGGRGGGEFPLSPHPSLPLVLGSYPLLASSPHL